MGSARRETYEHKTDDPESWWRRARALSADPFRTYPGCQPGAIGHEPAFDRESPYVLGDDRETAEAFLSHLHALATCASQRLLSGTRQSGKLSARFAGTTAQNSRANTPSPERSCFDSRSPAAMLQTSEDETPTGCLGFVSLVKNFSTSVSSVSWLYCQVRGERRIMPNAIRG